jgi:sulfur carrier protein ThiS
MFFSLSMEIMVETRGDIHSMAINDNETGEGLLAKLNLKPDDVILIINGKPIPYTTALSNGDHIKIIQVASGG